jgi:hypothetical protein
MGMVTGLVTLALVLALLLGAGLTLRHMVRFRRWYQQQTARGAYYLRDLAGRRAFAEELRRRGRVVARVTTWASRVRPPRGFSHFRYRDVTGPAPPSTPRLFRETYRYRPDPGDVFVATQMKCGTTWMQQLVYEVLMRGRGDLSDAGHGHLFAVSPWLESNFAIPVESAPRLGPHGQRIVKTHMPASLCPYSPEAKYIYVLRHPVACFGSCVDFVQKLGGPLAPSRDRLVDWFCSELMWWGPWAEHAEGWWRLAEEHPNVLFLHYEEMLRDPGAAVDRVAAFLDVPLSETERQAVIEKSSFDYMKSHEEWFEMAPPTPFSVTDTRSFFESGQRERERGGHEAERDRILSDCRARLAGGHYARASHYPELAEQAGDVVG